MDGVNPAWLAPEVVNDEPPIPKSDRNTTSPEVDGSWPCLTTKSDVYPFGIIMWEILTGCIPWEGLNCQYIKHQVLVENERPEVPESLTDPEWKSLYIKLMKRCWSEDLESRPSYEEILSELKNIKFELTGNLEVQTGVPLRRVKM